MTPASLPLLAGMVVRFCAPPHLRAAIEGDLTEGYLLRHTTHGRRAATQWLLRQLFTMDLIRLRHLARSVPHAPTPAREAGMLQDLRFALRALAHRRLYATAITATLAIGIGANTAVFTLVNSVLLRPLALPDSDRLVMLFRTSERFGFTRSTVSYPDFLDWRGAPALDGAAAYGIADRTVTGAGDAERLRGARVTAGFFPLLRVPPALGRPIAQADDEPGAPPVVVLSHGTWSARFGSRPDIVGQVIRLGTEQATVIGVMPDGFGFPSAETAFWMPLRGDVSSLERDFNFLSVIARLAPGQTVASAQRTVSALTGRIDAETPGANESMGVFVEPRLDFTVRNVEEPLLIFQWVVLLVLALACAGVTNLMLGNAVGRRREMAVRAALGASHGRLVRQAMLEAMLPGIVGGILGVALALGLLRVVEVLGASLMPRLDEVNIDWRVMALTAVAAIGCGILCGLAPALHGTRTALAEALHDGTRSVMRGRTARGVQDALVVTQIALALVLLVGSGLLAGSFLRLTSVQPGFDPSGVVAGKVTVPRPPLGANATEAEQAAEAARFVAQRNDFFRAFSERVASIPGVEHVGLSWSLPLSDFWFSSEMVAADLPDPGRKAPTIHGSVVDSAYFRTIGLPLLSGRTFSAADGATSPPVIVISRSLAELFWPGADAVGRRVLVGDERDPHTVVGVVGDTHVRSLAQPVAPMYYQPLSQVAWPAEAFVVVRGSAPPASLVAPMRAALTALDPTLPLTDITIGDALVERTVSAPRLRAAVLAVLGAFAVLLAVVGLYGVVALGVAERTREIGLRRALGARDGEVVGLIVRGALRLAVAGTVIGLTAAWMLSRYVASLLYGVAPTDVVTFSLAATGLLVVTILASLVPARRAARVDPIDCLRVS
jgi:predicted permease